MSVQGRPIGFIGLGAIGRDDDAAVVKVYEKLAGIDVARAAGPRPAPA